jgi:hypothetical protein
LVDGAYLGEIPSPEFRAIDVMLTTRSEVTGDSASWNYILNDDRYYYFSFEVESPDATVGDTFRQTVGAAADYNEAWVPLETPDEAKQIAAERGITLASLPAEATAQGQKIRENLKRLPIFREALRLVVNCLCYLSSPSCEVTAPTQKYHEPSHRLGHHSNVRARKTERFVKGIPLSTFAAIPLSVRRKSPPRGESFQLIGEGGIGGIKLSGLAGQNTS